MPLDLSASFVSSKTKFSIDQLSVNLAENKFTLSSELNVNESDFQVRTDLNYPDQRMIQLVKVFLQKYATEDLGSLKLNLKMNALIGYDMVIKKLDLDPLVNYRPPKKGISFIRNLKRDFYFDPKDGTRFLLIGKRNRNFVKYKDLKKELKYALLDAEDMSFFLHEGIEWTEIVNAMIKGSKKGKLRGASSISQQLSKNLFLVEERSITRKMQEALLAIMLEKELSKRRIFEIYVNIIQFGNKIRGIGKASKYYFGKPYDELEICEILWLSSIIPAPVANHDYFLDGEISPNSRKRMRENFSRLITWRKISLDKEFECKSLTEDIQSRSNLIKKKKSL